MKSARREGGPAPRGDERELPPRVHPHDRPPVRLPRRRPLPERFVRLFREGWIETFQACAWSYDPLTENHATLLGLVGNSTSRNGFMIEDSLVALVTHSAQMRAAGRLCRVKVAKRDRAVFDQLCAAQAGQEAASGGRVEERRWYRGQTRQSFDLLLRAGRLRTARQLFLAGPLGNWGAEQLADANLAGVEHLHLLDWQPGPEGAAALADGSALRGPAAFGHSHSRLESAHIAALARGPAFADLRQLYSNRHS